MLEHQIPLYTLESLEPVADFDLIGFTLQYEKVKEICNRFWVTDARPSGKNKRR